MRVQQAIVLCVLYDCSISECSMTSDNPLFCLLIARGVLLSATRSLTEPPGFRNCPGQYGLIRSHITAAPAHFAFALFVSWHLLHMFKPVCLTSISTPKASLRELIRISGVLPAPSVL